MFGGFHKNDKSFKIFLSIYFKKITYWFQSFTKFFSPAIALVWWWLQMKGWLLANVSNKETEGGIHSNLGCFINI